MDFEEVSRQLIRRLRGGKTQLELSRQLGFDSNVVYTWESSRRAPEMSRVFRMAELSELAVRDAVLSFFGRPSSRLKSARLSSPRGSQVLVAELIGTAPRSVIARRIGVDRTTVARWLQGKTEPRLPELLRLVHATTQRLLPFIECFVSPAELPATRSAWEDLESQAHLAYELPWSHAILRALELDDYMQLPRHKEGFLAQRLGLTRSAERKYIRALADAGQITWTGTHWVLARILTVDTRQNPEKNRNLKLHWCQVAQERLKSDTSPPESLFSYNLFAVSEENFQRIRELHLRYYDDVRALVDESKEANRVVLMQVQLVPLEHTAATTCVDRRANNNERQVQTSSLPEACSN